MKKPNLIQRKQLNKKINTFIEMNNSSVDYLETLLETHTKTFSSEEKENLKNLKEYLSSLTVFYSNLKSSEK